MLSIFFIVPPSINGSFSVRGIIYESNFSYVNLSWEVSGRDIGDFVEQYLIDISPAVELEGNNFTTQSNFITITLLYNQQYNISLFATNCAGTSDPIKTTLKIGRSDS